MALDFQKSTYIPHRRGVAKSTSYGVMNKWRDFVVQPVDNPYEQSRTGDFGRLTPILDIPLPGDVDKRREIESARLRQSLAWVNEKQQEQSEDISQALIRVTLADEKSRGVRRSKVPPAKSPRRDKRREATEEDCRVGQSLPVHLHYNKSSGYDDFHRSFLHMNKIGMTPTYPIMGPPRLRNGRVGGSWRHVKQVLQPKGDRRLFIDGGPRVCDNSRILTNEIPAVSILQPLYDRPPPVRAPAHEMEEHKAREGSNWRVMR